MRIRYDRNVVVEDCQRDLDHLGVRSRTPEQQTGPAVPAERANRAVGGAILGDGVPTAKPPETSARNSGKGRVLRAMKFAAHPAMTMSGPMIEIIRLEGDHSAQATALECLRHGSASTNCIMYDSALLAGRSKPHVFVSKMLRSGFFSSLAGLDRAQVSCSRRVSAGSRGRSCRPGLPPCGTS